MNLRIYNINSIKFHKDKIFCLLLLKDKRLISSSKDCNINIYNNISFEKDFSIKNDSAINFITQLKNEKIISCDFNSSIKIYILFSKSYNLIQIIKQNNNINKIIELNNLNLISCSKIEKITIYKINNNNLYEKIKIIKGKNSIDDIIEIKNNICVFSQCFHNMILFWSFINKKTIKKIYNVSCNNNNNVLCKFNENILLVAGYNYITIINNEKMEILNEINFYNNYWFYSICKLNDNYIVLSNSLGVLFICYYKDEMIYIKDIIKGHNDIIPCLISKNNKIYSCSYDNLIKCWSLYFF